MLVTWLRQNGKTECRNLDSSLRDIGGFSDVQWRFILEYSSQNFENPVTLEENAEMIIEFVKKRLEIKKSNIFKVKKWIESNECRRDFLLLHFEEPIGRNVLNCCDVCKLEWNMYKDMNNDSLQSEKKENWKDYLSQILLSEMEK
jgi:ATP-dependent DNA helicase RecQ